MAATASDPATLVSASNLQPTSAVDDDEYSHHDIESTNDEPDDHKAVTATAEWGRMSFVAAFFCIAIVGGVLAGTLAFAGTDRFRGDDSDDPPVEASREITLAPTGAPSVNVLDMPTTLVPVITVSPTTANPTTAEPTETRKCFESRNEISFALIMYNGNLPEQAIEKYGQIRTWCVSRVTDFSDLFRDFVDFNEPLDGWDVSQVTNMAGMFRGAETFNQPLAAWNTSSVRDMSQMFLGAFDFNNDVSTWQTSSVRTTSHMFDGASSFDQNLTSWDAGSVVTMEAMFASATSFNGDVSTWNVTLVDNFSYMFSGASSFDGDLSQWNVSGAITMEYMFSDATSFTGRSITDWHVPPGANVNGMLENANSFDGNVSGWPVDVQVPTRPPVVSTFPSTSPSFSASSLLAPSQSPNVTIEGGSAQSIPSEAPSVAPTVAQQQRIFPTEALSVRPTSESSPSAPSKLSSGSPSFVSQEPTSSP